MSGYIVKRLVAMLPMLVGVSIIVFVVVRVVPGDLVALKLGEHPTPEGRAQMEEALGLDRPIVLQYWTWVSDVVQGDFGESLWTTRPVLEEVRRRAPVTVELTLLATIISLAVAIPAGLISAVRQNSLLDQLVRLFAIGGLALPNFWLAILVVTIPAIWFNWAPPLTYTAFTNDPLANIWQMIFPALVLGYFVTAQLTRMTRAVLLETLRQDFIRTARAKGLRERVVLNRHALRNALIPLVTVLGNQIGYLIGGTVVIESIFSLPGMGVLILDALRQRDYPLIQGSVLLIAVVVAIINLVTDMVYSILDPRIQYG